MGGLAYCVTKLLIYGGHVILLG